MRQDKKKKIEIVSTTLMYIRCQVDYCYGSTKFEFNNNLSMTTKTVLAEDSLLAYFIKYIL